MSRYPFTGPNYAQYGEVPGYIYYPWNDQYYIDPQMVQQYNESVGLAEPAPKEPSYFDTLMPIAGTAAALALGTGVGNKIMTGDWPSWLQFGKDAATPAVTQVAPQAGQIAMGGGTGSGAVAAGGELGGGLIEGGRQAYLGSIPSGGAEVGTFDAGGPIGSNIGTVAQGALGAAGLGLGMKGMYDAYESGNPLGGAISGAGAGAGGLALAGSLGAATGGLALPVIAGAALLGGGLGFLGDRKTTKEYQQERWGDLMERGVVGADQAWAANHPSGDTGVWSSGKYAGQQWTFDKALDLTKDDPKHFELVYGNFDTFGNDWLTAYTPEQRRAIVSQLAHQGLYAGNKGDVVIKDKEKAREIADRVKVGQLGVQTSGMPQAVTNQGAPPPPTTTGTSRPKPLQEQDLVVEGQKQMEKGNMIPAGQGTGASMMHPEQLVQPTVQPQGMIPQPQLPQAQSRMLVIDPIQQAPAAVGFTNSEAFKQQLGQATYQGKPIFGIQQPVLQQQPVGMIPAPVRTQTLSPGIGLDGRPIRY